MCLHLGAFKADESCYKDGNRIGDETGYCKKLSENSYMACKMKYVDAYTVESTS